MPHAPFRLLRTTVMGATILGLAAAAHVVAGGTLPAPAIMAALLALHILFTTVATKFKLTLPVMMALLVSSQAVLHQGFESLSHGTPTLLGPGAEALNHHGMSAEAHDSAALVAAFAPGLATPGLAPSGMEILSHSGPLAGWMWAAHLAAALATAGLLAYGENALWSLANWLRPIYQCATAVLVVPVQSVPSSVVPRPLPRLPWRNLRPNTRRGPPLSAAVFA